LELEGFKQDGQSLPVRRNKTSVNRKHSKKGNSGKKKHTRRGRREKRAGTWKNPRCFREFTLSKGKAMGGGGARSQRRIWLQNVSGLKEREAGARRPSQCAWLFLQYHHKAKSAVPQS